MRRVSPCLPLSPHVCVWACVRRGVCFPEALSPLVSPLVSHCLPTYVPLLDGVHLPEVLSPFASHGLTTCVGLCVRLPEALSPFVFPCCPAWGQTAALRPPYRTPGHTETAHNFVPKRSSKSSEKRFNVASESLETLDVQRKAQGVV